MLHDKIIPVVTAIRKSHNCGNMELKMKTAYSKIQKENLETGQFGHNSPLYDVELYFVDILNSLDDMNIGLLHSE